MIRREREKKGMIPGGQNTPLMMIMRVTAPPKISDQYPDHISNTSLK
jgi:hypothetical protein